MLSANNFQKITDIRYNLRKHIFNRATFNSLFNRALSSRLSIISISNINDSFKINITIDRAKCSMSPGFSHQSMYYEPIIADALAEVLMDISANGDRYPDIGESGRSCLSQYYQMLVDGEISPSSLFTVVTSLQSELTIIL